MWARWLVLLSFQPTAWRAHPLGRWRACTSTSLPACARARLLRNYRSGSLASVMLSNFAAPFRQTLIDSPTLVARGWQAIKCVSDQYVSFLESSVQLAQKSSQKITSQLTMTQSLSVIQGHGTRGWLWHYNQALNCSVNPRHHLLQTASYFAPPFGYGLSVNFFDMARSRRFLDLFFNRLKCFSTTGWAPSGFPT